MTVVAVGSHYWPKRGSLDWSVGIIHKLLRKEVAKPNRPVWHLFGWSHFRKEWQFVDTLLEHDAAYYLQNHALVFTRFSSEVLNHG